MLYYSIGSPSLVRPIDSMPIKGWPVVIPESSASSLVGITASNHLSESVTVKLLYNLLALDEWKNFSRAAEVRSLTQTALSRRITSLEARTVGGSGKIPERSSAVTA